jgi:SAM-dependent methyltransferase
VLASDDLGQNWSQGRGIHLAKELLGSAVEIDQHLSVYDLASRGRTFDVILFLGVYYHLHDPFYALAQIRHCCHPGTVVVVSGPVGMQPDANAARYNFADHDCEWLPNEGAVRQLLAATYYTDPSVAYLDPSPAAPPPGRLGWRWRLKMCRAALRGSRPEMSERLDFVLPDTNGSRLGVFTCAPHEGEVSLHYYRPPFGLAAYDPRFRTTPSRRAA